MGRRLVFGQMRQHRMRELTAIGFLEDGTPVYPIRGAEEDGSGAGGGDDGKNSDVGDFGDDDGSGSGSEKDDDDDEIKDPKDRRIKELSNENASRRVSEKEARKELEALQEELRKAKLKDADELEKLKSDYKALEEKYQKLFGVNKSALLEKEALRLSPKLKLNWVDVDDVLAVMAQNSDVKIDDSGEIEGMENALKELAKKKPHWLKSEEDGKGSGSKGSGAKGSSGGSFSGNGGKGRETDRERLMNKYPSIRR